MIDIEFRIFGWDTRHADNYEKKNYMLEVMELSLEDKIAVVEYKTHKERPAKKEEYETLMQYIGLNDKCNKKYYVNDIGIFDNGDKFIIRCEEYLEIYIEWIGEPKCEDQARDLPRISKSTKIGNKYETPELLEN